MPRLKIVTKGYEWRRGPMISCVCFKPKRRKKLYELLDVAIGLKGTPEYELYTFGVCTPAGLKRKLKKSGRQVVPPHLPHLIVRKYNYKRIERAIEEIVKSIRIESLDELPAAMRPYALWRPLPE